MEEIRTGDGSACNINAVKVDSAEAGVRMSVDGVSISEIGADNSRKGLWRMGEIVETMSSWYG